MISPNYPISTPGHHSCSYSLCRHHNIWHTYIPAMTSSPMTFWMWVGCWSQSVADRTCWSPKVTSPVTSMLKALLNYLVITFLPRYDLSLTIDWHMILRVLCHMSSIVVSFLKIFKRHICMFFSSTVHNFLKRYLTQAGRTGSKPTKFWLGLFGEFIY